MCYSRTTKTRGRDKLWFSWRWRQALLTLTVVRCSHTPWKERRHFSWRWVRTKLYFLPGQETSAEERGVRYLLCCGCPPATAPSGSSSLEPSLWTSSKTCCYTVSTGPTQRGTSFGSPECPCINKQAWQWQGPQPHHQSPNREDVESLEPS